MSRAIKANENLISALENLGFLEVLQAVEYTRILDDAVSSMEVAA